MSVKIIYPEVREVSNARILSWCDDAYKNGEVDREYTDIQDAVDLLEDAGIITVAKR
jgi:hypothetical protein